MSQQHNPENKECERNFAIHYENNNGKMLHIASEIAHGCTLPCSCPSQSKQSQGGNKDTPLKPLPDTHPSRSPLPDTHPKGGGYDARGKCHVEIPSYNDDGTEKDSDYWFMCLKDMPCPIHSPKATEEKLDLGDDDFRGEPVPENFEALISEGMNAQRKVRVERYKVIPVPADNKDEGFDIGTIMEDLANAFALGANNWSQILINAERNIHKIHDLALAQEIAQAEKRGKIWATDAYMRGRSDERERIWEEAIEKAQMFSELEVAGYAQGKIISLARLSTIIYNNEA